MSSLSSTSTITRPSRTQPPTDETIIEQANHYVQYEIDKKYISNVQSLIDSNDIKTLRSLFYPRISFGTAGLRAKMDAGYKNYNSLVVIQTTQAVIQHLEQCFGTDQVKQRGLVVGYDGRFYSQQYAYLIANICKYKHIKCYLFSKHTPTPFTPYAILQVKSVCGIMVTASHNPAADNGYKLYWENGCQIISPTDTAVSQLIENNLTPWKTFTMDPPTYNDITVDPYETIFEQYFNDIAQHYCYTPELNAASQLRVTTTVMHGVGAPFVKRALEVFHLPPATPTVQQEQIDPTFPTVKFPNPEEGRGALTLAIETAEASNSSLIIANDPDADRMAVAEKQRDSGDWYIFNGNETAVLLADWLLTNYKATHPRNDYSDVYLVQSTVSSKILQAIAQKEGLGYADTLTGFKWIGNKCYDLTQQGNTVLLAYEVEIGFLVGTISYDKDGVRTSAVFNELASHWYRQGKSCFQRLQELYARYGFFVGLQSYFIVENRADTDAIFYRLRNWPDSKSKYPSSCGSFGITSVRDVTMGRDTGTSDGRSHDIPTDPSTQMLTFRFENGSVATLRSSGTEPKLKFYVECVDERSEDHARALLKDMTASVVQNFIQPEKYNLIPKS